MRLNTDPETIQNNFILQLQIACKSCKSCLRKPFKIMLLPKIDFSSLSDPKTLSKITPKSYQVALGDYVLPNLHVEASMKALLAFQKGPRQPSRPSKRARNTLQKVSKCSNKLLTGLQNPRGNLPRTLKPILKLSNTVHTRLYSMSSNFAIQ